MKTIFEMRLCERVSTDKSLSSRNGFVFSSLLCDKLTLVTFKQFSAIKEGMNRVRMDFLLGKRVIRGMGLTDLSQVSRHSRK